MIAPFVLTLAAALVQTGGASAPASESRMRTDAAQLRIDRGEGVLPLLIPRDEHLHFDVEIDVGILGDLDVGDVVLSSGVERAAARLPDARDKERAVEWREEGWVESVAKGGYMGYQVEHTLRATHLPQAWPSVFLRDTQTGSENRRRELKLGLEDGKFKAWFRNDGHCKGCDNAEHFVEGAWVWSSAAHCKKCKRSDHRTWRDARQRDVPTDSVDMLSAVYLARSLVRDGRDEASFPLVDKQRLWRVTIKSGATKTIDVPAGEFRCRKVELSTKLEAGEKEEEGAEHFQGLFGIQGKLGIWLEERTGVPVLIEGELPIPLPLVDKLDVRVMLRRHEGTPSEFQPQR